MIAAAPLAATALSSLFGTNQATGAPRSAAVGSAGNGFADMMAAFSKDTVDKMKTSETMSVAALQGKATTQSVVEAVMAAQESLQTALAVRDKAVSAFQDISRMPI